ncbi:MAG: hypothetical protein PSX80_00715 [bacterium]|nr:hypothetical protein [bacterium]
MEAQLNYFNYFTEIEETFIRRRAKNLFLSPLDWALMETWQEGGIPLHLVIRAIEQVFDNFDRNPGPRSIKGLVFCREEVEAQYEEWLKAQAGKPSETLTSSTPFTVGEISEHLQGLAVSLRLNSAFELAEDIDRACVRLVEIADNINDNLEQVDLSLKDVESLLDEALLSKSDRGRFAILKKETDKELRPYKPKMPPEAYKSTHRLMLLKRLREQENIPRLSLFYL